MKLRKKKGAPAGELRFKQAHLNLTFPDGKTVDLAEAVLEGTGGLIARAKREELQLRLERWRRELTPGGVLIDDVERLEALERRALEQLGGMLQPGVAAQMENRLRALAAEITRKLLVEIVDDGSIDLADFLGPEHFEVDEAARDRALQKLAGEFLNGPPAEKEASKPTAEAAAAVAAKPAVAKVAKEKKNA